MRRTFRNIILPERKTHLHVALIKFVNGYPKPEQIIEDIFRDKRKLVGAVGSMEVWKFRIWNEYSINIFSSADVSGS